jgi:serine/threonine-protein kinase
MQWVGTAFPDLTKLTPFNEGGQKWVFSAVHPSEGDVVLKIIHPNQDPEAARREIFAVQQIKSSRVPEIFETGQVATPVGVCVWIRERRVHGISLRERLQQGPLSAQEILRLCLHMLEPLVLAEQAHIVHRDVKPENIIVDPNGDFWLLDFGISRHLTMSPLTRASSPFGKFTLGYAPPEQLRNVQTDIDSRADLFALGVTIYEAAGARHPFLSGTADVAEIIKRVESLVLPPLLLNCKASASFRDLLGAMLQKRRDHRPGSAAEALDWITDVIEHETTAP